MVCLVENHGGGIFALIVTLIDHWGAVQRDLLADGLRYEDMGRSGDRELEFCEFATYVTYAPPGTAIFTAINEGWTRGDHFAAASLDELRTLVWSKTEDATKPPQLQQFRPKPTPRPGVVYVEPEPEDDGRLTAEGYLAMVGYQIVDE